MYIAGFRLFRRFIAKGDEADWKVRAPGRLAVPRGGKARFSGMHKRAAGKVSAKQLKIACHNTSTDKHQQTRFDLVTVDLAERQVVAN